VCVGVEGVFLDEPDVGALHAQAERASRSGADAVFLTDGPLGDAIVLAAALGYWATGLLLGVRVTLGSQPHRHPTVLAREMTTFDLVCGGRAVLALTEPFTDATAEAISLCKNMWRNGVAVSEGPYYPVAGAINRPLPQRPGGPPVALDLTGSSAAPASLLDLCDLVLVPAGAAPPPALPGEVDVCQIMA
jgi:alkanesulfonate monooxygenase SsuD/methylene tetrahydromethanopterin reductase-like flavin-dependent oxidoreductase (luciferase family)